jgi:hypothetical protein
VKSLFEKELKRLSELEVMYRKIDLLDRKKKQMGLDEEEEERFKDTKKSYYDVYDQTISSLVDQIISSVISNKGKVALQNIQDILPWDGRSVITVDDFEKILMAGQDLDEETVYIIEENLQVLHLDVFKGLETFCSNRSIYIALESIGQSIAIGKEGGMENLVTYIDDIYRDFGEIFGIDLPEVKLFYY